ncbi:MAG: DUF1501 domain-containing protein [Candidatus Omnitrophica bacterium]|nr:DUF1501 domain-containing protein [Candidatus Omnitrophota bacterium]
MFPCERMKRRDFLRNSALGLAGAGLYPQLAQAAEFYEGHPLAPKPSHFPAKAKQMVFIFLTGGFSHIDTFDPKIELTKKHGQKINRGILSGSQFNFQRYGESGLEVSELFAQTGKMADDLCVLRSMKNDFGDHFQGTLAMHTGSGSIPMPSLGSWLSYGLGTLNPNLPSYMVLAKFMPYAGGQNWDNSFLPTSHQGVRVLPGEDPIPNLKTPVESVSLREMEKKMLHDLNLLHAKDRPNDPRLTGRMSSFEIARGMMGEAPEAFDLSKEKDSVLASYGVERGEKESFSWQCLIARRLIERGVRVVQLVDTGANNNWDAHGNMETHRTKAKYVDQGIGALIGDLKERGLLDETLVVCCTEFGRTPFSDSESSKGRGHHRYAFTCFMAGGGTKGGHIHGETDELGMEVAKDPVHYHDFHATILHLMGFDHEKLTYRYGGRDFRLTDVAGNVVKSIIA